MLGVEGCRTRRERTNALFRRRRTAERETIVVVSMCSIIDPEEEDMLELKFQFQGAGGFCQ